MKVGDLCKFVGTTGWGTYCIITKMGPNKYDPRVPARRSHLRPLRHVVGTGIEVLSDDGSIGYIAAGFLEVVCENKNACNQYLHHGII